jgi:hypothetical protein
MEWHNGVIGGVQEVPGSLAEIGGTDGYLRQLIAALPGLFPDEANPGAPSSIAVAAESVGEWRSAAVEFQARVRRLDLLHGALGPDGLSQAAKRDLLAAYVDLVGFCRTADLLASEVAERLRPLMLVRLQEDLAHLDSWPIRRGGLLGLYARALVAEWVELAEASPPIACTTPGCANSMPPTRNRLYCDSCKTARKAAGVREIRARANRDS